MAAVLIASAALCLNLSTVQYALLVAALALAVEAARDPRGFWRDGVRPTAPLLLGIGGLLLAILLSQCATPVAFDGFGFWQRCRAWLGAIPLAIAFALGGPRVRRWAVWCLLAGGVCAALIGIAQHLWGIHPGAELLGVPAQRWQEPAPNDPTRYTALGLFYNHTRYAHVLVVALAFAVGQALSARTARGRLVGAALAAILLGGFLLSYTRAALAAFALALVAVLLLDRIKLTRSTWIGLVLVALAVALAVLLTPSLRGRLGSAFDLVANRDRQFIWRRAFEIVGDFGATGIGFNGYHLAHPFYYDRANSAFAMRSQAHNLYLTFFVEMGPLGVLALLGLLWTSVDQARATRAADSAEAAVRHGSVLALGSLIALSLFHDPLYQAIEACAFFYAPAMLAALVAPGERPPSGIAGPPLQAPPWARRAAVAVLWLAAGSALGAVAGPALVALVLVVAGAVIWKPRGRVARLLLGALLGLGLAMVALQAPLAVTLGAAVAGAIWLAGRARRAGALVAAGCAALWFPALLAMSDGVGDPPSWTTVGRATAALVVAGAALTALRATARPPHAGAALGLGALLLLFALRTTSLVLDLGLPVVPAPRYDSRAFEATRLGATRRAAEIQRELICDLLKHERTGSAINLQWWGVLLAPAQFAGPEGRLWRSELIAHNGDLRQAREVALGTVATTAGDALLRAARLRRLEYQELLAGWLRGAGREQLARSLERQIAAPQRGEGFASCLQSR
ncbi:MAG: O-antigen ligase family protein [Deltaproteobacteria bacterium]|nr:O-antigen ligase family protein [Deltaproteobacteria bacterium]